MKIYVKFEEEQCELLQYANMKDKVVIKSPSEGILNVLKREIEVIGFRNGKGDTGELKII